MKKKVDYSKIFSPSKLSMFSQCPKQYHFSYLDPIYRRMKGELKRLPENIWTFHTLGKAVHNSITLFYHLPEERRTKDHLLKGLKECWKSEVMWNKKPPLGKWGGFKTLGEERNSYREALLMLNNFFKITDVEPEIAYLPSVNFKQSIDDYLKLIVVLDEETDVSGKFDLIIKDDTGFLEIIDFKTSKKEEADESQLEFYKVLAEANFEKLVNRATLYFLKTGSKKSFNLEEKATEKIKDEISEKIKNIRLTKDFEPKPSKLCQFCLFKAFCPQKKKVVETLKGTTEEDYPDDLPF